MEKILFNQIFFGFCFGKAQENRLWLDQVWCVFKHGLCLFCFEMPNLHDVLAYSGQEMGAGCRVQGGGCRVQGAGSNNPPVTS